MPSSGIYAIVNRNNGKRYIGSTTEFKRRWAQHRCYLRRGTHPNRYLLSAWNKYGEAQFDFLILEEVLDLSKLEESEQRYLNQIKDSETYNLAPVAGSQRGVRFSAETRARMSAAKRQPRKPLSEEHKAAISRTNTGRRASLETREKQSAARKGKPFSEEHRAKIRASALARWAKRAG